LVAKVNDGNASDKIWNKEIFDELESSFLDLQGILYVADSALVTLENLNLMAEKRIRFVSRLPEAFGIAKNLKEMAWQKDDWEFLGAISPGKNAAQYWTSSFVDQIGGRDYRFVVVRSSALDKRREKSLERQLKKELVELEKAKKELGKQEFSCLPDAQMIMAEFLSGHNKVAHGLSGKILKYEVIQRKPGRPRKAKKSPTVTKYRIELSITEPTAAKLQELRERANAFVLITTEPANAWSDLDILTEYKGQSKVEARFRFLKHPLVVDGIFLKSPRRIEALAYVVMLALLVAAFIERRVRFGLAKNNQIIETVGKRKTNKPTIKVILDMLSTVNMVYIDDGLEMMRILPSNIPPNVLQLIELAGHTPSIYTTPMLRRS
jgi:transposase